MAGAAPSRTSPRLPSRVVWKTLRMRRLCATRRRRGLLRCSSACRPTSRLCGASRSTTRSSTRAGRARRGSIGITCPTRRSCSRKSDRLRPEPLSLQWPGDQEMLAGWGCPTKTRRIYIGYGFAASLTRSPQSRYRVTWRTCCKPQTRNLCKSLRGPSPLEGVARPRWSSCRPWRPAAPGSASRPPQGRLLRARCWMAPRGSQVPMASVRRCWPSQSWLRGPGGRRIRGYEGC
mmetsp:Transcript_20061/g.55490  ORF Transcript_20061/g.55490 Transcript_20061/m.55490 type:complete len:233 (-) Transcript_20061:411-1109(-)